MKKKKWKLKFEASPAECVQFDTPRLGLAATPYNSASIRQKFRNHILPPSEVQSIRRGFATFIHFRVPSAYV